MSSAGPPATFTRQMACTEAEWLRLLPPALAPYRWQHAGPGVTVALGVGQLRIDWHPLPPQRMAALALPQLRADFVFQQVDAPARRAFMARFDLYTHRGGG